MKKALIISLALNIAIIGIFAGKRYYYSYGPGAGNNNGIDFNDKWNRMRASVYNDLSIDSTDIVFVGNSLTEGFPVTEIYGRHVINRGIGGNTTGQVLARINNIAKYHPKKIFLEIGINDLTRGYDIDSVIRDYESIIKTIRAQSPTTVIYVQSLIPTCHEHMNLNSGISVFNNELSKLCKRYKLFFINIYYYMVIDGQLDSSLTEDGLHLNGKGYAIWKELIEEYIH